MVTTTTAPPQIRSSTALAAQQESKRLLRKEGTRDLIKGAVFGIGLTTIGMVLLKATENYSSPDFAHLSTYAVGLPHAIAAPIALIGMGGGVYYTAKGFLKINQGADSGLSDSLTGFWRAVKGVALGGFTVTAGAMLLYENYSSSRACWVGFIGTFGLIKSFNMIKEGCKSIADGSKLLRGESPRPPL